MNIEPFGYFRSEPFGWTDCEKDDDGAMPLFCGAVIMDLQQQLATERASLFAESQRKQQLEQQVEELAGVLGGLLELHDSPAPFSGKTGEERMRMLENATAKRNAAIFAARAVIKKVRGGEC